MRRQLAGLLACAALCTCAALVARDARAAGGDKKGKDEIDLFQGSWTVVSASKDGQEVPEEIRKELKMSFAGKKITISIMGMDIKGEITLDPSKSPKHIDIMFEGKDEKGYGIYKVEGDTIKICAGETKDSRPKEFKDANGAMLIVIKKAGKEESPARGKTDKDRIQGTWVLSEGVKGGKPAPADIVGNLKISFKGDKVALSVKGDSNKDAEYKIDETKKPKQIDITIMGKTATGIYELDKDTLKICISEDGNERPKEFKGEAAAHTYMVFKREQAKSNPGAAPGGNPGAAPGAAPGGSPVALPGKTDRDLIQGTWQPTNVSMPGKDLPKEAKEFFAQVRIEMKDGKFSFNFGDMGKEGTYKIDPSRNPKHIDITIDDMKIQGIYEFKGDTLRVCSDEPGKARPDAFDAAKFTIFELKKIKDQPEEPVAFGGDKGKKSDKDFIQGTWAVESIIDDGMELPAEIRDVVRFEVKGDTIKVKLGDLEIKGKYTVDETKKPKTVDLTFEGDMKAIGIYEITGDKVKFCIVDDKAGAKRPTEFKSTAGSGMKVVVLKRAEKKDDKKGGEVRAEVVPALAVAFLGDKGGKDKGTGKDDPDKKALEGTWLVTKAVQGGMDAPAEFVSKVKLIVKGDKMTLSFEGQGDKDAGYKIDSSKKPKTIDLSPTDGKMMEGIYEVKDDTLKFAFGEPGSRPTEFKSDAGSKVMLMEFKRAPKKDKAPAPTPEAVEVAPEFVVFVAEQDQPAQEPKAGDKKTDKQPEQPAKLTDADRLVGTWKFLKARGDGEDAPGDMMANIRLTFQPDGKLQIDGLLTPETADYKLDAATGHLDLVTEKKKTEPVLGIYKFDGDKLTICFGEGPNSGKRPTEFSAEKGSKQVVFVLERVTSGVEIGNAGDAGRRQGSNNVRQMALAFHNYHDTYKHLPLHAIYSKDGKTPLLSWRVAILPFIEQNALYQQFKLDEPWDSEHNKKLIAMMPRIYMPMGQGAKNAKEGQTYYVVFTGTGTPFDGNKKIKLGDFKDGTSNTGMIWEAKDPVTWTKPDDLVLPKEGDKLPELGGMYQTGMHMALADGSIRWVRKDIPPKVLRALVTHSGGEAIDFGQLDVRKDTPKPAPKEAPGDEGRRQSTNNLKQIALAFHQYHDNNKYFPVHAIYDKEGKTPLLSWRVAILPYIDQDALYKQFKLDEPWNSEHNMKLIAQMPRIYEPVGMGKKVIGKTYYQVFTGPSTAFDGNKRMKFQGITDGTSNTGMIWEAKDPVVWTKPDDLVLPKDGDKLPELGGMFKTGMNVAYFDGSVRWVRKDIPAKILRAVITPNGGEVINDGDLEPPAPKEDTPPPPPAEKTQEAALPALESANNLKQIALAMHAFHDIYKRIPGQAIYSKDGKPLLSWRVAILPFIEQVDLYQQFKLDEPWDSDHNKKLIAKMPKIYVLPGLKDKSDGRTSYVVVAGPNTAFPGPGIKKTLVSITDGTSNTAFVFEGKESVIWTKPDDLELPKDATKAPMVGGHYKGGMNVAFFDGSVHWLRTDLDAATLRAIITPAGNEAVDVQKLEAPPLAKKAR
jgi:uncharacterized protein (TIGR03067 family)/prepilin-type processing-associated H-X9-DG protein